MLLVCVCVCYLFSKRLTVALLHDMIQSIHRHPTSVNLHLSAPMVRQSVNDHSYFLNFVNILSKYQCFVLLGFFCFRRLAAHVNITVVHVVKANCLCYLT